MPFYDWLIYSTNCNQGTKKEEFHPHDKLTPKPKINYQQGYLQQMSRNALELEAQPDKWLKWKQPGPVLAFWWGGPIVVLG